MVIKRNYHQYVKISAMFEKLKFLKVTCMNSQGYSFWITTNNCVKNFIIREYYFCYCSSFVF